MNQRDAIVRQQFRDALEKGVVIAKPDMLEHADRHDPVEDLIHVAVVRQREGRLRRETLVFRPPARDGDLLARKRYASDLGVAGLREIERETAPAAADVENAMAGLDE